MSLSLIRAVLFTDPLIVLATIAYGSASLAVSFFDLNGGKQMRVARAWSRMLLRVSGVSVTVEGLENIDPDGSYIFAANHASYMDTPVVLANIPVRFRFLAKQGLFRIPLLGGHLRRAGHVPVPRGNPREAVRSMTEAGRLIREHGTSLLIFPEGGRSLTGLQEFREGAAYIAIKAGVPVVPVALKGTPEILPMHSCHVKSGKVLVRVGAPLSTEGLTLRDRGELTQVLRERMLKLLA